MNDLLAGLPTIAQNSSNPRRVDYDFPAQPDQWNGLVLVGEAPGAEEARLGRPFVGRSGQLLDKILRQSGIDRSRCLIANVFRFQPPGNKVDHFFISRRKAAQDKVSIAESYGKFGSNWCRRDYADEIDNLRQTLHAWKPKMIVGLGRTPLWALTGQGELLKKVGHVLPSTLAPGFSVMPTYHPSFILRGNWGLQDEWARHFVMAKGAS